MNLAGLACCGYCRWRKTNPPPADIVLTKISRAVFVQRMCTAAHRRGVRRVHALFFLLISAVMVSAQGRPYLGMLGGIATLSGDAGSQATAQGLNLSSYAPANGGAIDAFAGVHLHDYFSVQGNFIWNENDLQLNSASSGSGTFYQESRSSSQAAGVFDFLIYFRRRQSRIRPYLGGC